MPDKYCYCYCYMVQDLPEHPVGSQRGSWGTSVIVHHWPTRNQNSTCICNVASAYSYPQTTMRWSDFTYYSHFIIGNTECMECSWKQAGRWNATTQRVPALR
jgi:hypothetical protein